MAIWKYTAMVETPIGWTETDVLAEALAAVEEGARVDWEHRASVSGRYTSLRLRFIADDFEAAKVQARQLSLTLSRVSPMDAESLVRMRG